MRLILIDSLALIHRSYHALPKLTTPKSEAIGAVYGFTMLFLKMLQDLKPDYIAAAFDLPEETFRHKAYREYQAHRPETPEDLSQQITKVRALLEAFGVPIFSQAGYEADDLIGTLVEKLKDISELEIIILTGDLDTLQLVSPRVKVYTLKKGLTEIVLYDEGSVRERFGFSADLISDFKGLKGDASDNIPGVPGVGEKTAKTLLTRFGKLEAVYEVLENRQKILQEKVLSDRQIALLLNNRKGAFFSRDLATIRRDVPIEISFESLKGQERSFSKIKDLFAEWGFRTLLSRVGELEAIGPQKLESQNQVSRPETISLISPDAWQKLEDVLPNVEARYLFALPPGAGFQETLDAFGLLVGDLVFIWSKGQLIQSRHTRVLGRISSLRVWDGKALIHLFRNNGVQLPHFDFDCKIAGWLIDPDAKRYGLHDLSRQHLGVDPANPEINGSPETAEIVGALFLIKQLYPALQNKLQTQSLEKVWGEIEKPLIPVLAQMEATGIGVVPEELARLSAQLRQKLSELEKKIYRLAGERFNLASPKQLSRVLFDALKIPTKGIRRTPSGIFSTDSAELEKVKNDHPILPEILAWREASKILTTYADALPKLINPKTARIHTTFLQTGTATGRLASENPNLQNIPKRGEYSAKLRQAFRADDDWLLASFDYSQIELRIAAHLARDNKMIQAFQNGTDIHALTASQVWNVPLEKVTSALRNQAKALNFGVIYGMGWRSFAQTSGIDPEEAKKFIEEYFRDFAGISKYISEVKEFAKVHGYAQTLTGRKRSLAGLFSLDKSSNAQAERIAINMPIQGFAADLIKLAMVKIHEKVEREKWQKEVRMLLQVHDELLFEIKREKIEKVIPEIKEIMENVWELRVPIVVDVSIGDSWGEMGPWPD